MRITAETVGARSPQRKRGKLRVAAIMQSATELFIKNGYDATTMTEIARRSKTAIGSLYRFFPTKQALADTLLLEYAKLAIGRLEALELQASEISLSHLASAFVALVSDLSSQRNFALALAEERGEPNAKRSQFRKALRDAIRRILKKAIPELSLQEAYTKAVLLLHILKALPASLREKPAVREALAKEVRDIIELLLHSLANSHGTNR